MLKDILNKRGISVYKLSKETGISYSTLNDVVIEKTDIKNVSANMLYRIAKYLNLTMEMLYEGNDMGEETIYVGNEGRNVILQFNHQRIQYLGPKNLFGFQRVNRVEENVVYVSCYFEDEKGCIYTEEDYIDLAEVLCDYKEVLLSEYHVVIGKPSDSMREKLIQKSLLVSDNIAILYYIDEKIPDRCVRAVSLARPASSAIIRLKDCAIVSSNMSNTLQKRALDAVKRNIEDVQEEIEEVAKYA